MTKNTKQTSPKVASLAGKALQSGTGQRVTAFVGRFGVAASGYACTDRSQDRKQGCERTR